ncbi:MAG: hypothetical protein AABM29_00125 [Actinomycetota bacterium]
MAAVALAGLWLAAAAPARGAGGVLVVGDSLEVGTSPYLRQQLPGIPLTVDARTSRPSGDGVEVLGARLRPTDEVVVFDLGVNDDPAQPEILAGDLRAARSIAGDRCMVVATLSRPPLAGVSVDGLNSAVRNFAAQSPPVALADWRAATLASPGLLAADGVHATPQGYAVRAQIVAQAIGECLASGAPTRGAPPSAAPAPSAPPGRAPPRPAPRRPPPLLVIVLREIGSTLAAVGGEVRDGIAAWVPPPVFRALAGPAPPAY